nr:hypothetical protein MACL_00000938 [Theileria orientalis]
MNRKFDWFQDENTLTLIIYESLVISESVKIKLEDKNIQISYKTKIDSKIKSLKLKLTSQINNPDDDPKNVNLLVTEKKIEVKLFKKEAGLWDELQSVERDANNDNKKSTLTNKFNDKELDSESSDDDSDLSSEDQFMNLLKSIYSKGDDNTRRAMIKSFIRAPSQIGEDHDLQIGDPSSSITDTFVASAKEPEEEYPTHSSKAEEACCNHTQHTNMFYLHISQILDELSEIEPPSRIEPPRHDIETLTKVEHVATTDNCQRDYSKPCPLQFTHELLEDGSHKCVFPKFYSGPCLGQDLIYKEMGNDEKVQWSKNCMANWPCVFCNRIYSLYCPGGFECKALNSYSGPCKEETYNFIDYNIAMQKDWSRMCKSYWPCSSS